MNTSVRLAVAALAALPAVVVAQGNTVPQTMAGRDGGSSTSIPFGLSQPTRWQCVYDAQELPWSGPRVISSLSFRADNDVPGTTAFSPKQYLAVSMVMSTTAVRAEDVSATFDDNHGSDATVVIANARIALPDQPVLSGPPGTARPANIAFPFDQPWIYGTTPVRPAHVAPDGLVFDLRIQLQPTGAYRLDSPAFCNGNLTRFGGQTPLCVTSAPGNHQMRIESSTTILAGGSYTYTVDRMLPNTAFSLMLSLDDPLRQPHPGTFLGQNLPVPLFDSANPNLPNPNLPFLFSAPGCYVNIEMQNSVLGVADGSGVGRVVVAVPPGRRFVDTHIYAQAVAHDVSANPLLFTTSLGLRSTVCGPLQIARIYNVGDHQAQTGQRNLGEGAIFEVN